MENSVILYSTLVVFIAIIAFVLYKYHVKLQQDKMAILVIDKLHERDQEWNKKHIQGLQMLNRKIESSNTILSSTLDNRVSAVSQNIAKTTTVLNKELDAKQGKLRDVVNKLQNDVSFLQNDFATFTKASKKELASDSLRIGSSTEISATRFQADLAVGTNGYTFTRNNKLGMNNSSPNYSIDVVDKSNARIGLSLKQEEINNQWTLGIDQTNDNGLSINNNSKNVLHMTRNGRVGVNNTKPLGALHVNGSLYSGVDNNQYGGILHENGATKIGSITGETHIMSVNKSALVVDKKGNVGMGVMTPKEALHVSGNMRSEGTQLYLGGDNLLVARNADGTVINDQRAKSSLNLQVNGKNKISATDASGVIVNDALQVNGNVSSKALRIGNITLKNDNGNLLVCPDGMSCRELMTIQKDLVKTPANPYVLGGAPDAQLR